MLLGNEPSFYKLLCVLLVIDIGWVLYTSPSTDKAVDKTIKKSHDTPNYGWWAAMNAIAVALILAWNSWGPVDELTRNIGLLVITVVRTVTDYFLTWRFYYPSNMEVASDENKPVLYIAGPYSHNELEVCTERFDKLTEVAAKFVNDGFIVYSPITHTHPIEVAIGTKQSSEFWVDFDKTFMALCTRCIVVKLPGWDTSKGVAREIAWFEVRGIKAEYVEP